MSRILVDEVILRLKSRNPDVKVVSRDLGEFPIPHLTTHTLAGIRGLPETQAERQTRQLSDQLLEELRAADIIVIGAPMYNFSISTTLRAWLDHVLRAGETFAYSEKGPQGLLKGKQAIIVQSRGGFYSDGPARQADFQEPYLQQLLGFMGITEISFIHAEKVAFGLEARGDAINKAKTRIAEVVAQIAQIAA